MLAALSVSEDRADACLLMQQAVSTQLGLAFDDGMVKDISRAFLALLKPPKHEQDGPPPIVYALQLRFSEMHVYFKNAEFEGAAVARTYRR